MASKRCSFCRRVSSMNDVAMICHSCAKGRAGDRYCDFCKTNPKAEEAYICQKCAKGLVGDRKCDFCDRNGRAMEAQICGECVKR